MDDKNRRSLRIGLAIAVLILGLLYLLRRKSPPVRGPESKSIAANTIQPDLQSAPRIKGAGSTTRKLDAKDIDAAKAKKLIASALWRIVNAKSYRMVMTSVWNAGSASFTLIHAKSPTRGDLFRMDTVNYDTTMKPVPGLSRIEITNERGNWEMDDEAGSEGVAFLLKDSQDPVDTVALHKRFEADAQEMENDVNDCDCKATNASMNNRPVINITYGGPTYTIDAVNGDLLSVLSGFRKDFELNPILEESDFNIPESQIIVPVSDKMAAQRYLSEHK